MQDTVIKVENLSKVYNLYDRPIERMKEALSIRRKTYHRDHYALKDVSFEVKRGENIGIIGVNGAGKSTLLKIITGVTTPTTGSVQVNGKISALLELGTGFNPEYTGIENIYLNGTMMGYSREQIDAKVDSIVEFAGIGEFIHQPVKTYSSGMFARLAFAVAINVEPEILIVDEVLSVGDTRFQIKCMDKMKQLIEGGTTVLFVSHDTYAIRRFCTRAVWINKGEVMADGDVNLIADKYMDFLKLGDNGVNGVVEKTTSSLAPFIPGEGIADIVSFRVLNNNGQEIDELDMSEAIRVEVIYDVYDETMPNVVLGVAIRSVDDDYVCGLNTMADNKKIPWKFGRNCVVLEYSSGILAVGGRYYFDVALYEETTTVPIQYKSMIKEFIVTPRYAGEGRYIMPHKWIDKAIGSTEAQ